MKSRPWIWSMAKEEEEEGSETQDFEWPRDNQKRIGRGLRYARRKKIVEEKERGRPTVDCRPIAMKGLGGPPKGSNRPPSIPSTYTHGESPRTSIRLFFSNIGEIKTRYLSGILHSSASVVKVSCSSAVVQRWPPPLTVSPSRV